MALILNLETSTTVCSAAISNEGKVLAFAEVHIEQSHAAKLAPLIDSVIDLAGIAKKNIEAIAVSSGPGSYTGLRIGVSTAKGLCYALGIPLLGISTLELMARQVKHQFTNSNAVLCPMIDARRMEVYCMLINADLVTIEPVQSKIIEEHSFKELLKDHEVCFFGNGADKCSSLIVDKNAIFLKGSYPSAAYMGPMAFDKLKGGVVEDLIQFEPFYLKEFQIKKANESH